MARGVQPASDPSRARFGQMKNDPDPLTLSAVRGARLIALDRVETAGKEADHLSSDPDDLRALHDLRVALRRVRSWLKAFKPELEDGVKAKDRHRLRDLVDVTNRGRDADVQLAWLRKAAKHGDELHKRGAERLIDVIKRDRRNASEPLTGDWFRAFSKEQARLAQRLSTVREPVRTYGPPPPTLAAAIGARLTDHLDALLDSLNAVHSAADDREAHQARIAAKRLRYLIEPVQDVRGGKTLITELKKLQDELGSLHDAHVLGRRVDAAIALADNDRESLQAIADALAAERAAVFARVERHWKLDETAVPGFSRKVRLFGERLKALEEH